MKQTVDQFNSGKDFTINGKSMYKTFGLVCNKVSAGRAKPKFIRVSVVGADGALDLTKSVSGAVTYEPRTLTAQFSRDCESYWDAVKVADSVAAAFHGVECVIKAPEFDGGYMIGSIEVGEPDYFSHALTITLQAECDPYIYRAENGSKQLPPSNGTQLIGRRIDGLPREFSMGSFKALLRTVGGNGYWNDVTTRGAMVTASTDNMLDIGIGNVLLSTHENGSGSWARSGNMYRSGQRVYTRAMSDNWVHRVSVLASKSRNWMSEEGGFMVPVFPLQQGGMFLTAFLTGSVKSGSNPLIKLNIGRGTGRVNDESGGGIASSSISMAALFTPVIGKQYIDEPITVKVPDKFGMNEIWIDFENIASDGMGVSLMLSKSAPSAWVAPNVKVQTFSLGSTMQRTAKSADTAEVSIFGTKTTKNTVASSDPRVAKDGHGGTFIGSRVGAPADGSKSVMFMLVGTSGLLDNFETTLTTYAFRTQTISNDAMPATPSVTCGSPTVFVQNGKKIATGPGDSQLLPITIGRGSSQVEYAVVGDSTAILSWKRGYL